MTSTEQQIEQFIGTLVSLGGSAGNQRLLEALGWQDSIYQRVKQQLIDDGRIRPGRGRGGSVALAESVSSLPKPVTEPTAAVKRQANEAHKEDKHDATGGSGMKPIEQQFFNDLEKIAIVQQSFEPGMTVLLVARQHSVAASQLFLWRKQYQEGSLTAVAVGEQVIPASEQASAMKQIKELQRLLGKKTMENELLKEAVEYGRQKSG